VDCFLIGEIYLNSRNQIVILLLIISLAICGCIGLEDITGETQKQKAIVTKVSPLINEKTRSENSDDISLHGKALIWDLTKDSRSDAYDSLPDSLRAASSDKPITIFMITDIRDDKVGVYTITGKYETYGIPAYQRYVDIFVAYWPENRSAGKYTIKGEEPPEEIEADDADRDGEFGDINSPIANWIANLPREKND
jgi:hypothetical protein